jgi:hypothetical protein
MWIAIFGVFVLVTVLFGHPRHQESSDASVHDRPAAAAVAGPAEPGETPNYSRQFTGKDGGG